MFVTPIVAVALAAFPVAFAQDLTNFVGTWSSGAKNVVTGAGFANPANMSFTYPLTTGVSYAFSEDGFYEVARYRFTSNGASYSKSPMDQRTDPSCAGAEPNCITGVLNWHHGTYTKETNGSLVLTPFGDGFQQIQDPCAAETNFVETYNNTELYQSWQMFYDQTDGLKLHLFQFDGSPVAPLFQVYSTPNMLPTQLLRNDTTTVDTGNALFAKNAGSRSWTTTTVSGVVSGVVVAGVASLLL
ncbi:chaperone for protein-folding within the ER, fungal-domain-containing protein [Daedaleopsis nitida]|nr:chaperone for protein-folding within the ER, fungal-domain-containing protein [Daedaleopsis nitida]